MSKKLLVVLTVLVIGSLFFAACAPAAEEPVVEPTEEEVVVEPTEEEVVEEPTEEEVVEEPEVEEVEEFKIGLVTDVGEIDDKSFNQSAWEGVLLAEEEFGAIVNYVETADAKDYMSSSLWVSPWAKPPLKQPPCIPRSCSLAWIRANGAVW